MDKTQVLGLACGYCGSSLPPGNPNIVQTTRPDARDVRRFLAPGGEQRPSAVRQTTVTTSVCADCRSLTRYACRSVWNHIVGEDIAAKYSDEQLHRVGASIIRPLFETQTTISGPQLPWSHISVPDCRIALAALDFEGLSRDYRRAHKSGQACGSCGVLTADEWQPTLIKGYPVCSDCGTGMLSASDFSCGRRIKSLFGPEMKVASATPYVPAEALLPFAATDAEPTAERWGYVTEADRDKLRAYLCAIGHPLVPQSWKDRFAKPKAALAPVARKPEKVGAVGIAV